MSLLPQCLYFWLESVSVEDWDYPNSVELLMEEAMIVLTFRVPLRAQKRPHHTQYD